MIEKDKIHNLFQSQSPSKKEISSKRTPSNYLKSSNNKQKDFNNSNLSKINNFNRPEKNIFSSNNSNYFNYGNNNITYMNNNQLFTAIKERVKENNKGRKNSNISNSILIQEKNSGNNGSIAISTSKSKNRNNILKKSIKKNDKSQNYEENIKNQFENSFKEEQIDKNNDINLDNINNSKKGNIIMPYEKSFNKSINNNYKNNYNINDNNKENNENNGLNQNNKSQYNKTLDISNLENKAYKQRNLSCNLRKKKKIKITNLKYAQNISSDKDQIILLENGLGVNDCFLNSIIQVLFHLEEFKNKLFQLNILQDQNNPIFQLYTIFCKYESLSKLHTLETLNAASLRKSLHYKFGNYEKGKFGDPMETISEILELIHNDYFNGNINLNKNSNINCENELCPSHSNFLINLKEIKYCPNCKAKNVQMYNKDCFMYDVLSYEILSLVENENFNDYKYTLFQKLKKLGQSFGDNKQKLEKCNCKEINTTKRLFLYHKFSPYLIINITWDSDFPKMSDICKIYGLIPIFANNKNLFSFDFENNKKKEKDLVTNYYLCSMILFGQNHYTCFFYNKVVDMWSFVNDDKKKNFNTYNELIKFLILRRSIPVGIIFYYINNFNVNINEKCLLNEEEFNVLYKKSLENDKRDIEERENKKLGKDMNSENNISFENEKDIKTNKNYSYRTIEKNNENFNISIIHKEGLGTEKIIKIKRSKKSL